MRTYDNNLRRDYTGVSVNKILLIRFMITRPSVRQEGKPLIDRPLSESLPCACKLIAHGFAKAFPLIQHLTQRQKKPFLLLSVMTSSWVEIRTDHLPDNKRMRFVLRYNHRSIVLFCSNTRDICQCNTQQTTLFNCLRFI